MLLLLVLIPPVSAWTVDTTATGDPVRWDTMPIPWVYVADDAPALDDVDGAIEGAFDTWTEVAGVDVEFEAQDAGDALARTKHDGVNVVWFDDQWPEDEAALALTTTFSSGDGTMLGFDVRIDPWTDWSTTGDPDAYDLQAALTHEIGHALGLEHSELQDATMYGLHGRGDWRRVLHTDDEHAVRHLYSTNDPSQDGDGALRAAAENVVEIWSCATPGAPAGPAIAPALLVVIAFRLSRKSPSSSTGGSRAG